jgi:sortase A
MSHHKPDYYRVLILRTIGNFLVLGSLFFIAKTFYQPAREEVRYFIDSLLRKKYVVVDIKQKPPELPKPKGLLANALKFDKVEFLKPEDPSFSIVIPKIAANSRIIANVDTTNDKVYLNMLQKGVAHAMGTAFPGEGGHIFLFAHSTDYIWNVGTYNAVFYLLYKLEISDQINVFYQGKRYTYRVTGKTIVDPSQVEYLTRKTNKEFLTLQTCWPPGTTLKRLLVFAVREAE